MPRGSLKVPLTAVPGGVTERFSLGSLPPGKWGSSSNFLTRDGNGSPRNGYERVGAAAVTSANRIIGFGFRGSITDGTNVIVHTLTNAYWWNGSSFADVTGTWTTTTASEPVRFTTFVQSGTLRLIRTNPDNAPDYWVGTSAAFTDLGGGGAAKDITSTNGRVVILPQANTRRVQWSDFNDSDTWGASSFTDLNDTPDNTVACQAFGPLSMSVLKEDSVWLGVAQAAATPFRFQLVSHVPGPVAAAALATWRGTQYWLAKDGVIYSFDGATVEAVGTDLSKTLRDTWDWDNRALAHAWILARPEPELWVSITRLAAGTSDRAVCLNLVTNAMTMHSFAHDITASSEWTSRPDVVWDDLTGTWDTLSATYSTWDAMATGSSPTAILGDVNGNVYRNNVGVSDNSTAIAWNFVSDWKAPAENGESLFIDGVTSYWEKTSAALTVTVGMTPSVSLGDADTESTSTFDTSTDSSHLITFADKRGHWVRVKHSASSVVANLRHRLAEVMAWPRRRAS